jgi:hypothetical protein
MHTIDRSSSNGLTEADRLANRTALLTLLTICSFLLAAMTMPLTFQRTGDRVPRVASAAPLPAGVGFAIGARAAGARLKAARERERQTEAEGEAAGPAQVAVGEPPRSGRRGEA